MAPVGKTGLSFAVNTNWNVFTDGKDWFLLNNGLWMMAQAYTGPYQPVFKLPSAFSAIPADANFAAVRSAIPPKSPQAAAHSGDFCQHQAGGDHRHRWAAAICAGAGTGLQSVTNTT